MNIQSILELINSLDITALNRVESLSDSYHQAIRLAICENHTNMVVGCPNFENMSGIALHLVKVNGVWKIANTLHQTSKGSKFGCSVDISANAKRIIVGSHDDQNYLKYLELQESKLLKQLKDIKSIRETILKKICLI